MSPACQLEMTLPGGFPGVPGVTVRLMSDGERARFGVLRDLDQRRLTIAAAAQLLRLERRQVFRLLTAYGIEDTAGLTSKRRGGPSNRRKPAALRGKSCRSLASGTGTSASVYPCRSNNCLRADAAQHRHFMRARSIPHHRS
jgi:hypothetical protein